MTAITTIDREWFPVCSFGDPEDLRSSTLQAGELLNTTSSMMLEPPRDYPADRHTPKVIVPMSTPEGFQIALVFGRRTDSLPYTPADHHLILASTAHISHLLRSKCLARRLAGEMSASLQLEAELKEARQVQHRLLNGIMHGSLALDYYAECKPASEVGGDFFDFLPANDGSLLISIGDVTGKGVPAALIMAGLQASARILARSRDFNLSGVLHELNRMLWDMSPENMFATMFYARIDAAGRRISYVNAGHEPAILVRPSSGQVWRLRSTATVLGLSLRCAYREDVIEFRPGDILVVFTDGISEACDQNQKPFGEAGVLSIIEQQSESMSSDLVNLIMQSVEAYSACSDDIDDRTICVVSFPELPTELANEEYALTAIA